MKFIIMSVFMLSLSAMASQHQMIDTLGVSPKGQYVALEEYGYVKEKHTYYVTVKIINVWTKKYEGQSIEVETPAHRPVELERAREKARGLAQETLDKYKIST